jgi:hypothetical protein
MQKKEAIQKYMEVYGGDGHTIVTASCLVEMGFDVDFVAPFAHDHISGEGYKATIFDTKTGNPFKSCFGVYSLDFAYAIARDVEADTEPARMKMGRGFQAHELYKSIEEKIKT